MSDTETIAVYDARAQDYNDRFGSGAPSRSLRQFMDLLPAGAHVLDLGCGPGHSAAHMAAAGHTVTATDASSEMVRLAGAQAGVTARQATFSDLTDVDAYDGVWANFSLLHAPRDLFDTHLFAIARALIADGVFHIGLKTGSGTKRDGLGRNYTYFERDDLIARLTSAGFTVFAEETGIETGLAGTDDPWIILRARKHG